MGQYVLVNCADTAGGNGQHMLTQQPCCDSPHHHRQSPQGSNTGVVGSLSCSLVALTVVDTQQRQATTVPPPVLFVGCLTSQQQASVSQGRICSENFTCCHTEVEAVDQTFYLTQSQYTDTGLTTVVPMFKSLV